MNFKKMRAQYGSMGQDMASMTGYEASPIHHVHHLTHVHSIHCLNVDFLGANGLRFLMPLAPETAR